MLEGQVLGLVLVLEGQVLGLAIWCLHFKHKHKYLTSTKLK